jgi:hypothetical protein
MTEPLVDQYHAAPRPGANWRLAFYRRAKGPKRAALAVEQSTLRWKAAHWFVRNLCGDQSNACRTLIPRHWHATYGPPLSRNNRSRQTRMRRIAGQTVRRLRRRNRLPGL